MHDVVAPTPPGGCPLRRSCLDELSRPPAGELVGITKIGKELFLKMMQFYNSDEKNKLADYETDALVAVAGEISIPCLIIDDLIATGGTAEAAAKLIEISHGKVACFVFVINLFDLNGSDNLLKKGYKVENLIEFPGH